MQRLCSESNQSQIDNESTTQGSPKKHSHAKTQQQCTNPKPPKNLRLLNILRSYHGQTPSARSRYEAHHKLNSCNNCPKYGKWIEIICESSHCLMTFSMSCSVGFFRNRFPKGSVGVGVGGRASVKNGLWKNKNNTSGPTTELNNPHGRHCSFASLYLVSWMST